MSSENMSTEGAVLPEDIWSEIAERLSAFDVFSLSQACRELYFFLSRRDLWIRVLRSVCRRHGVFLPTYPVSETEMTLAQIQLAASRPERWHDLIRKRASRFGPWDVYASMRRNLDRHPEMTPTLEGAFWPLHHWRVHLVPGGRFLVILTLPKYVYWDQHRAEPTTVVLSICDLGVPGSTDHRVPSILASQSLDIACTIRQVARLSHSEVVMVTDSSFRVVVVHPNGPVRELSWTVLAFDVKFSAHDKTTPSLKRRRASITIDAHDRPVLNICLRGDRVLLRFPQSVVIWDVETMKYVGLEVPDWDITNEVQCRLAVLTNHHLVCIDLERLGIWRLSPLDWMDGGTSPHVDERSSQTVPPDIVVSDPWNYDAWDRTFQFTQVITPAIPENRVYFDVHYKPNGKDSTVRYQLDVTAGPSCSHNDLPIADQGPDLTLTLIFATHFPIPRFEAYVPLAHGQLCYIWGGAPGARSYAYVPRYHPGIALMTLPKLEEESALTRYVCLGVDIPQVFCALSGRMICVRPHLVGIQQNGVKVVDYLP